MCGSLQRYTLDFGKKKKKVKNVISDSNESPLFFHITYSDSTQTQCVRKRKQNPIIHDIMKYFGPRNETEFTATSPTNGKFRLKT